MYIYYGRYTTADISRQICYSKYITTYIYIYSKIYVLWPIYITADILRQIHNGRYIAYSKTGSISANLLRQKLAIAVFEPACCNTLPQGLLWTGLPRAPADCPWALMGRSLVGRAFVGPLGP